MRADGVCSFDANCAKFRRLQLGMRARIKRHDAVDDADDVDAAERELLFNYMLCGAAENAIHTVQLPLVPYGCVPFAASGAITSQRVALRRTIRQTNETKNRLLGGRTRATIAPNN